MGSILVIPKKLKMDPLATLLDALVTVATLLDA